jgi:antitoxin (DNA-binding transcriptional repressor) of toxin-antitoxin stability system
VITDHGRVIARILPAEQTLEERLHSLQEAGLLDWNGRALEPVEPPAVNHSPHSLAELIVEMRE